MAIDQLEVDFPTIVKELEAKLLTGELDARRQQRITFHHSGFTCEADTLGSHGYVYLAIYHTQDTADRHVLTCKTTKPNHICRF